MVKPAARREVAGYLIKKHPVALSRICRLLRLNRSTCYYRKIKDNDKELRQALKALAEQRRRWGYRMLMVLLRREGFKDNHKRIFRLYQQEGLQLPKRHKRHRAQWRNQKLQTVTAANERWSMDFVSDQIADGRKLRLLSILDNYTRQCLAIEVDTGLCGHRVSRVLDRILSQRGQPQKLLTDNGPEFTGKALDRWAYEHQVALHFIEPGKPVQNAHIESFNATLRNECLNEHWFLSLEHARELVETWRIDYNQNRPHSSLGGKTPDEFAAKLCARAELATEL